MATRGRIERRLALAIVLVAGIPLIVAIYFANTMVDSAFAQAFTPELGEHLDQSLGVYTELKDAIKDGMSHQADAIAARATLKSAAAQKSDTALEREVDLVFARYPKLVSVRVTTADGAP